MALLYYTTEIDPDKTAAEIARCLSMHGATAVMTEYDKEEGFVRALAFQINVNGNKIGFRLPCDWKPVLRVLENDPTIERRYKNQLQAVRTAWRIVKGWVDAQMALVETQMVTTQDVFLPYAVMADGRTLAEHAQTNPSFLLGSSNQ